jgi:hypothetical protein
VALTVPPSHALYIDEHGDHVYEAPAPLYLFRGAAVAFPEIDGSFEVRRIEGRGDTMIVTVRPFDES